MKKSAKLFVLAIGSVMALATGPGNAAVTGAATVTRMGEVEFAGGMAGASWMEGYLTFATTVGVAADGSAVLTSSAQASLNTCDPMMICTYVSFPDQVIQPTAVSMDPIGNQVTFTACLRPDGGGACRPFNLRLARPSSLSPTGLLPVPNAWVDGSTVHADGVLQAGRSYSVVSGAFGPVTLPLAGADHFAYVSQRVGVAVTAS